MAALPQASVALQILVMLLAQPVLVTGPSAATGMRIPLQLSEAVAPLGPGMVGLQPSTIG